MNSNTEEGALRGAIERTHLNLGIRPPSGSIEKQDVTPTAAPAETRLPYPMQLGSGTGDITPGLTYLAQAENWSGGAQVRATIRLGHNDAEYRLGNRFMGTAWTAVKLGDRPSEVRLAFGVLAPVFQRLNGPQLEMDYQITMGLQYSL